MNTSARYGNRFRTLVGPVLLVLLALVGGPAAGVCHLAVEHHQGSCPEHPTDCFFCWLVEHSSADLPVNLELNPSSVCRPAAPPIVEPVRDIPPPVRSVRDPPRHG